MTNKKEILKIRGINLIGFSMSLFIWLLITSIITDNFIWIVVHFITIMMFMYTWSFEFKGSEEDNK